MTIKPIETAYAGHRFRSRLEARWAVFFDALGFSWEYEPEGFTLHDGTRYLPDFYLPRTGTWVEVKGRMAAADLDKCIAALDWHPLPGCEGQAGTPRGLLLLGPIPKDADRCTRVEHTIIGHSDGPVLHWSHFEGDQLVVENQFAYGSDALTPEEVLIRPATWNAEIDNQFARAAYIAARGARFEHGERGR